LGHERGKVGGRPIQHLRRRGGPILLQRQQLLVQQQFLVSVLVECLVIEHIELEQFILVFLVDVKLVQFVQQFLEQFEFLIVE